MFIKRKIFFCVIFVILCRNGIESLSTGRSLSEAPKDYEHKNVVSERFPIAEFDFYHVYFPFVITISVLFSNLLKILYVTTPKLSKLLPEACVLILMGILVGLLLHFGVNFRELPLSGDIFFLFLLPPIIFEAGYFIPKRLFFNNLGTIVLMAVVGTILNIFATGVSLWGCGLTGLYGGPTETPSLMSTLMFTSVVAATDPVTVLAVFEELHVNELLYIIVLGEALLNDAVTIVLFHVLEHLTIIGIENVVSEDIISGFASFFFVSLGGIFIGTCWGLITGFLTRFTKHALIVETSFIFIIAYLSYLNAEMLHMSGLLAIAFCAISMKRYVESNVNKKSKTSIRNLAKTASSSTESLVFVLLGVSTIQCDHVWNTAFVLLSILFLTVFRCLTITFLSCISNRNRLYKLTSADNIIMSVVGLRGAVAFALVLLIDEQLVPQRNMFITTTFSIIYFTVFLQGSMVKSILGWLNIKLEDKRHLTLCELTNGRFTEHMMAGLEDIIGAKGNFNICERIKRLIKRYLDPLLLDNKLKSSLGDILLCTLKFSENEDSKKLAKKCTPHMSFVTVNPAFEGEQTEQTERTAPKEAESLVRKRLNSL